MAVLVSSPAEASARVPFVAPRRAGLLTRVAYRIARRSYGRMPGPVQVTAHSPWVFRGYIRFEYGLQHARSVDPRLIDLACARVAQPADCPFCIDIGIALSLASGVEQHKLDALSVLGDTSVYSPLESLVLEYASAMTSTPGCVTDELTTRLREHFTEKQLVELTAAIAFENYRARFNSAMGNPRRGLQPGRTTPGFSR